MNFSITNTIKKYNHLYKTRPLRKKISKTIAQIQREPQNYHLQIDLARHYLKTKKPQSAIGCLKTAVALGLPSSQIDLLEEEARELQAQNIREKQSQSIQPTSSQKTIVSDGSESLLYMHPPIYQRLKTVADTIQNEFDLENISILDVGGGEGWLSMFLPETTYALAEPTVNGLYGNTKCFPEHTFDIVVSCHVLEHIPEDKKWDFLEGLTSLANKMIILLGPVADIEPGKAMTELTYKITNESWAKEHLDCYLPKLNNLRRFAEQHGLNYSAAPNSHRASVYWMVFAAHYARMANKTDEFAQVKHFANEHLTQSITSSVMPNDYLVILRKD